MKTAKPNNSVLAEILEQNQDRDPALVRLKCKRMAGSAFAFFRGACGSFARSWDQLAPPDVGPAILVCGDLHLENFGAFRDDDGAFVFDINDFDEAVVAPCAIDPVRCASSILLAAELWALSPLRANRMVLAYLDAYRAAVMNTEEVATSVESAPRAIREILGRTAIATEDGLLDHQTERLKNGDRRIIRSGRRHPELTKKVYDRVLGAVDDYAKTKDEPGFFKPIDATARIAGIGSLGVKRYLVLVAGDGPKGPNRLLDVKAERPAAWSGFAAANGLAADDSDAARVVRAQRALQARPTAGLNVIPVGKGNFRIREMIPEENRSSLDRLRGKPVKLYEAIVEAGRLTGLAHRRGATAVAGGSTTDDLMRWASGAALDSVLVAAARYAETTRRAFKRFRAELIASEPQDDAALRQRKKGGK